MLMHILRDCGDMKILNTVFVLGVELDISLDIHQCARFTHNTNESQETAVKRICRYLQGTKDNSLVFNPSKKLMVDCYADA